MKNYELLDAVGGIDAGYIDAADRPAARKKTGLVIRWAAAACLVLIAAVSFPYISDIFHNKGGADTQTDHGGDSLVQEMSVLEFNGAYYEATNIPEVLERYGLPSVISEDLAGEHLSYLQSDGATGYTGSAVETDIELLRYAPVDCRGVYIIRDGEKYLAALFGNIIAFDTDTSAEMTTLYRFYGIEGPGDIASIAEVDWHRDSVVGNVITDSSEISDFYDMSTALTSYGNDSFQAVVFDSVPEDQQVKAHTDFADDCRVIRIETTEGLRFYIDIYPSYGWIYGGGTLSYYRIGEDLSDWISRDLN